MNGNNSLNGNNVNISNSIASQFSPESQLIKNSINDTTKVGRQLADGLMKGFEEGLKNSKSIENQLKKLENDLTKQANSVKNALDPKSLGEYRKQLDEVTKISGKLKSIKAQLAAESEKEIPNEKRIYELRKEQIKQQDEAQRILATQQLTLQLINAEREKEKLLAAAVKEEDKEKARNLEQQAQAMAAKANDLRSTINEINNNINQSTKESIKLLDDANKKSETWADNLQKGFDNVVNSVRAVTNLIDNVLDFANLDNAINAWSTTLDQYTKLSIETGQAFSAGYANTPGFQSFKNDMLNAFTDNGLRGIYDKDQLMNGLSELSKMGFQNSTMAKDMANDIQFAREYMGITSSSLKDMYALQVRTNDDQFVKKSLNAVISLQKAGNVISQEHLNTLIESNKTTIEKLMDLGMNAEAASRANQELLAIQNAYDATYGQGTGQAYVNSMLSMLNPDQIGANVGNVQLAMSQIQNGAMLDLRTNISNSPSTRAALQMRAQGDATTNFMIGSDPTVFGGVDSNLAYRLSGKDSELLANINENMRLISEGQDKALEEAKQNVQESIADSMKTMNSHMQDLLEKPWDDISESLHNSNFAKTAISRFQAMTNILTSSIALLVMALHTNTAAQAGNALSGGGKGGFFGKLLGPGSTLGGSKGMGFNMSQGLGNGLLAKGIGIGGTMWAVNDAISGGFNGLYNSSGEQVAGGGFGTGLASAVSGTKVYDSTAGNVGMGALGGAAKGAMIGTFFGPWGTVIGGGIGALCGLVGGIWKDNKRKEQEEKKRAQEQLKYQQTTAAGVTAIKNQRDAALINRFNDDRWGTRSLGVGSVSAPAPAPTAPPVSSSYGAGGEWNGIDIDGWKVTSDFASNEAFRDSPHKGIDFAGHKYGDPIGAATSGKVTKVVDGYTWKDSDPSKKIYKANYVDVYNAGNGATYRYYHLSGAAVAEGQEIVAGQVVGYVGNTGHVEPKPSDKNPTAGTHLHFAVLKGGGYVNPTEYVTSSIFHPGEAVLPTTTAGTKATALYNRDASPISLSYIPSVGDTSGAPTNVNMGNTFNSPSIEEKLDTINNTLIAMDNTQRNQQKLLDALSNSPIYELGV